MDGCFQRKGLTADIGWEADVALPGNCRQFHRMGKLLSVVEDVFQISGRGSVVVVPGIPREGDWHVKTGDPLTLKLPDGTEASTVVRGIEMASPPHPRFIPILLGLGLTKNDVPIGTEIWIN